MKTLLNLFNNKYINLLSVLIVIMTLIVKNNITIIIGSLLVILLTINNIVDILKSDGEAKNKELFITLSYGIMLLTSFIF
jgi:hypothetical protein